MIGNKLHDTVCPLHLKNGKKEKSEVFENQNEKFKYDFSIFLAFGHMLACMFSQLIVD